jgi:hypothetical protein
VNEQKQTGVSAHVLSAAKEESQAKSFLALSKVPQAGSGSSKALPDLPSSSEAIVGRESFPKPIWHG